MENQDSKADSPVSHKPARSRKVLAYIIMALTGFALSRYIAIQIKKDQCHDAASKSNHQANDCN